MSDLTPIPKSSSPPKSDMADSADSNTSPSPCPALEAASPNTSLSRHSTPASGSNKADSGDEVSNSAGTQSDARESGHGKRGRKRDPGSKAMTQLMNLTGLDAVKDHFEKIRRAVEINRLLGVDIRRERYHAVFQGNPGTGKTTVARIYANFLHWMGIVESSKFVEISGGKLASEGPSAVMRIFGSCGSDSSDTESSSGKDSSSEDERDDSSDSSTLSQFLRRRGLSRSMRGGRSRQGSGGVLFVDEAYQLVSPHASNAGRQALDIILTEMEKKAGRWTVVFAGYKGDLEAFFAHNEGLQSRVPHVMEFSDFDEAQLRMILLRLIEEMYGGRMKVEDGPDGLYIRAAVRRLSRGRGKRGFGNARAVENLLLGIRHRHAERLAGVQAPSNEELFLFTAQDLIGPRPSDVKTRSGAWAELDSLVGLDEVKKSVEHMFRVVEINYQLELDGRGTLELPLNRIFVGSPGTGKTTVAKLYGRILADLGFLSNGDVVLKKAYEFIGQAVGESEAKTRAILASTLGKVLIIDEAYMLDPGDPCSRQDSFKTAILDVLVAEIQSVPGDDRCVILLGYEDEMASLFQNGNKGLSGRFMADQPFRFADYSLGELESILRLEMKSRDLVFACNALDAGMGVLSRSRMRQNFGNGREVSNIVSTAVSRYLGRQQHADSAVRCFNGVLDPEDFDPDFSTRETEFHGCGVELEDRVSNEIIKHLERYQRIVWEARVRGHDTSRFVPRTFVFKGSSGTGRTTVARYMGKMFYEMGFLPTDAVVEFSAADLIGQHVGHTIPKTRTLLRRGLGRVLVVDDAHRLTKGGYTAEAVDELTSFVRKFSDRMVVILVGQTDKVDELMGESFGLRSLFPHTFIFKDLTPHECLVLLERELMENGVEAPFSAQSRPRFLKALGLLAKCAGWSNARDIKTLASRMTQTVYGGGVQTGAEGHELRLDEEEAMTCIKEMFVALRKTEDQKANRGTGSDPDDDSGSSAEATSEIPKEVLQQEVRQKHNEKEKQSEKKDKSRTAQEVLREMAPCEFGYGWVREGNGYRCKGGMHTISDAEIQARM